MMKHLYKIAWTALIIQVIQLIISNRFRVQNIVLMTLQIILALMSMVVTILIAFFK